ncbi:DUF305 domain-containing protein (plasmid) [Haloferacaceae archaeon DSL9]
MSTIGLAGYTFDSTQQDDGEHHGGENEQRDEEVEQADQTPSEDSEFNVADVLFMRMMIMHHERAIEMAELTPTRTDRQELLDLGQEIMEKQEAEIDLMCDWLDEAEVAGCDEVGGMTPRKMEDMMSEGDMEGMMSEEQMGEMMPHGRGEHVMTHDDKRQLRRAENDEFDCLFVEHMITHHEGAIMMAERIPEAGESQRVADLAEDIITDQQEEISTMEAWQNEWNC